MRDRVNLRMKGPARAATGVLLAVVLTACGGASATAQFSGTVLQNPYTAPDTTLSDTEGNPYSLAADTDKRLTLVFFGYTSCEDICHIVMNSITSALTRLDPSDREQVDVVFVTTDPKTDTPQVLRDYLDRYDPEIIGVTGELDDIIEAGEPLAVGIDVRDPGGHTTQVTAVDGSDEAPVYWGQNTSSAQYAADIHTLLDRDS